MKTKRLLTWLMLGTLSAATASCSNDEGEEPRFPEPETLPKRVTRIEAKYTTRDFTYDDQGRIAEYIATDLVGSQPINTIIRYSYPTPDRIQAVRSCKGSNTTPELTVQLQLDDRHRVTRARLENDTASFHYDENGYFYEADQFRYWYEYLYSPAGKGCNLTGINYFTKYEGNESLTQSACSVLSHSNVANNLNIDLSYILMFPGPNTYDYNFALSLFDLMGRRQVNLPDSWDFTLYDQSGNIEHHYRHSYRFDDEGYITRVDVVDEPYGSESTYLIYYE